MMQYQTVPQPVAVVQQPMMVQQPMVVQQVPQQQPQYVPVGKEKYCGIFSWLICLLTGIWCIVFCPIDERDQKVVAVGGRFGQSEDQGGRTDGDASAMECGGLTNSMQAPAHKL